MKSVIDKLERMSEDCFDESKQNKFFKKLGYVFFGMCFLAGFFNGYFFIIGAAGLACMKG